MVMLIASSIRPIRSLKLRLSSNAAASASLISTLFFALCTENSRSESNKSFKVFLSSAAALTSFVISSPKPLKASFIPSTAPFVSPLKNFNTLSPNLETLSFITSVAAPIPASASLNLSAPLCVLVK